MHVFSQRFYPRLGFLSFIFPSCAQLMNYDIAEAVAEVEKKPPSYPNGTTTAVTYPTGMVAKPLISVESHLCLFLENTCLFSGNCRVGPMKAVLFLHGTARLVSSFFGWILWIHNFRDNYQPNTSTRAAVLLSGSNKKFIGRLYESFPNIRNRKKLHQNVFQDLSI